jgi:hypothetical protein
MSISQPRLGNAFARIGAVALLSPFLAVTLLCGSAQADITDDAEKVVNELWDAAVGGKVHLDMRARYEYADAGGVAPSNALTLRTRLGYGTGAYKGVSAFGEFDYVAAMDPSKHYWDVVSTFNGKTPVADPRVIELNQAYLKLERDELKGSSAIAGRQRIILDDARWIGNVGWRQNEQTYDSVLGKSRFGVEDFEFLYSYIWDVRRIFGDQDNNNAALGNFASNSHVINASYTGLPVKLTGFIYLLDLENNALASRVNSSATYGIRANGKHKFGDELSLGYTVSYAYQTDYGKNPVPGGYGANYLWASAQLGLESLGSVGVGYELLGSDGGNARVVTPLATGHKFNGWADVFLNNGGPGGLQDLNFNIAPKLPWKFAGKIVYHYFWGADLGNQLGHEWDILLKRPINKYFDVLAKYAYYVSAPGSPAPFANDVQRVWLQATVKF